MAHPDTGSETASLISLDPKDLQRFQVPAFTATFSSVMPTLLIEWIADIDLAEKEDRQKQKQEDTLTTPASKWRCVEGVNLQPRSLDVPAPLDFVQCFFDTVTNFISFFTVQHFSRT